MKYRKIINYKYELSEDFTTFLPEFIDKNYYFVHPFFSLDNAKLSINKYYAWDGVSGPTIDTKNTFVAGLVHDVLYQSIRLNLLPKSEKKLVDKIFKRMLIENGMSKFRATYFYWAVKWFGKNSTKKKKGGEEAERIEIIEEKN